MANDVKKSHKRHRSRSESMSRRRRSRSTSTDRYSHREKRKKHKYKSKRSPSPLISRRSRSNSRYSKSNRTYDDRSHSRNDRDSRLSKQKRRKHRSSRSRSNSRSQERHSIAKENRNYEEQSNSQSHSTFKSKSSNTKQLDKNSSLEFEKVSQSNPNHLKTEDNKNNGTIQEKSMEINIKSQEKSKLQFKTLSFTKSIEKRKIKDHQISNQDEIQQRNRREKLKLWREQKLRDQEKKRELVKSFLAPDDITSVPILQLTELESEEKIETDEERINREKEEELQRQRVQKVVNEIDPLDAYMAGLQDDAAIQEIAMQKTNVISFDQIIVGNDKVNIYGTFLPQPLTDVDSEVDEIASNASVSQILSKETEEEREAREERELREFMEAIKKKNQTTDNPSTKLDSGIVSDLDTEISNSISDQTPQLTGRIYQGYDEDVIGESAHEFEQRSALEILQEAQKKKEIKPVDHSTIDYAPFQKKFYVVPQEIKDMTDEEVKVICEELEIKVRGKNCPRPLSKWAHCGFSVRMLQLIQKHGYIEPFAIQRQALPAIMSGRDVIGIAKTGSGKTLAFLLPMFRHILHQPPLQEGEGPIGLIMAPARELCQQIYLEAKKFAKGLGMRATAVYGGSAVSEQIANLKRGSDIVICTPGRMIDILCMSAGKMVSLKRVTYVVLDEADRMFDMGFEPQITKILMNVRSDRQTLLFSATFPRAVEALARKVLKKPIEITVGARSTASGDIAQFVEVREESDKFMRLLQLLGIWYEKGNILVFVNTQQACDQLFQDLMKAGYHGLSLHGGKDQIDRDYTIDDFKRKVRTLMVATSVAGRGLDVKDLVLVINYHCPNHLEDYVHRVGRTGRAGQKGTAYTFISPDEEEYAVDLVKALEAAKQTIPVELTTLANNFSEKVARGEARFHGSGFKGKGYTFDDAEKSSSQQVEAMQKRLYELDQGIIVEDGGIDDDDDMMESEKTTAAHEPTTTTAAPPSIQHDTDVLSAVKKAQQIAQLLDRQFKQNLAGSGVMGDGEKHFEDELEINDYPQQARWKVTQKEASDQVAELTGAAVIARGSFVAPGRKPNPGERKLYLAIEGPTQASVIDAKRELQRILDETVLQVGLGSDKYGKYNL